MEEEPKKSVYKIFLVRKDNGQLIRELTSIGYSESEALVNTKAGSYIETVGLIRDDVEVYVRQAAFIYDAPIFSGALSETPALMNIDLPQSMHIAALTAVNTSTKKGTIVRKWHGENYTYEGCYVSLQALEAYQAGKVKLYDTSKGINAPENADSFVLVYFVSENPYDTALEIPVIMDKLVK